MASPEQGVGARVDSPSDGKFVQQVTCSAKGDGLVGIYSGMSMECLHESWLIRIVLMFYCEAR